MERIERKAFIIGTLGVFLVFLMAFLLLPKPQQTSADIIVKLIIFLLFSVYLGGFLGIYIVDSIRKYKEELLQKKLKRYSLEE